jgi:hypothetical protein
MEDDSQSTKLDRQEVLGEIAVLKAEVEAKLQPIGDALETVAKNVDEILEKLDEIEEKIVQQLEDSIKNYSDEE